MPFHRVLLTDRHLQDLNPVIAGWEACKPGHRFGPAVRKYTLIHYVSQGRGIFYARGGTHPVLPGQAFLILPDEIATYEADTTDPWTYHWIGFDGTLSAQFAQLPPVFPVEGELFRKLFRAIDEESEPEYRIAATLFLLYSQLFSRQDSTNRHVRKVESLIRAAYMQPLRVEEIAAQLSLDRRYLSRLFRSQTGQTIQDFLVATRLEEAALCLSRGVSVQEAARLCGYEDVSNFSKMFKRRYGLSPANWKQAGQTPGRPLSAQEDAPNL